MDNYVLGEINGTFFFFSFYGAPCPAMQKEKAEFVLKTTYQRHEKYTLIFTHSAE